MEHLHSDGRPSSTANDRHRSRSPLNVAASRSPATDDGADPPRFGFRGPTTFWGATGHAPQRPSPPAIPPPKHLLPTPMASDRPDDSHRRHISVTAVRFPPSPTWVRCRQAGADRPVPHRGRLRSRSSAVDARDRHWGYSHRWRTWNPQPGPARRRGSRSAPPGAGGNGLHPGCHTCARLPRKREVQHSGQRLWTTLLLPLTP